MLGARLRQVTTTSASTLTAGLLIGLLAGLALGVVLTSLWLRSRHAEQLATARTTTALMQSRIGELLAERADDNAAHGDLTPVREGLARMERAIGVLERDRVEHFGELGERLAEVTAVTTALRTETATLAGSLNASAVRGSWGETQLRRLLEHAGMLARCDFDEQVMVDSPDGRLRPDAVLRLPGDRSLVIDAKAPMTSFLRAQADGLAGEQRRDLLRAHAAALRGHVDVLGSKKYWAAFPDTPEMVVCFVPSDAVLASALDADPALFDHAHGQHVVLASPGTLLALLRTVAYAWQQDALSEHARELLRLGSELYARLGTLGDHVGRLGSALRRSVESYNSLVGTLESRVLVTARRMQELDLASGSVTEPTPLTAAPRPLTSAELLEPSRSGDALAG